MKKLLMLISILVCSLWICDLTVFASTESEMDSIARAEIRYGITGDKQTAPSKSSDAGIESINTASGNLSYEATDLVLKGKAGLDLVVKRQYNSQMQDDEQDSLVFPGSASLYDWKFFKKPIYRYYVNGNTSNVVYVAFENEEQMLTRENGTAQLKVADNYSGYKITAYNGQYEQYSVNDTGSTLNGWDILNAGFYLNTSLPQGDAVTLTRDIYTVPAILNYDTVYSYGRLRCEPIHEELVGYGWSIPRSRMDRKSTALDYESSLSYYYYDYGEFIDPDGIVLNYYIRYQVKKSDDSVRVTKCEMYNATTDNDDENSGMYTLYVDDYNGGANYNGIEYKARIVRYDGTAFYMDDYGGLVAQVDRFGNMIKYDGSTITDSYGRTIQFHYEDDPTRYSLKSITVDGKIVVTYAREELNGANDPSDVLKTDDTYSLKVKYGDNDVSNNEIAYKAKLRQDIVRMYNPPSGQPVNSSYPCKSAENYQTYCIDEVLYPTGGKTIYSYDKVSVYNWSCFGRDKEKIHERKDFLAQSSEPYNYYVYTYNDPEEGKKNSTKSSGYTHTSTTTRQNDNFVICDMYNNEDYLIETKVQSLDNVVKRMYEYKKFNEGNKKITKETVQEYNKDTSTQYVERVTTYDYNDKQQPILEKQGNLEVTYAYDSNFGLLTNKYVTRNDTNKTHIAYILSSGWKTVNTENVYDVIIATGAETLKESRTYAYNSCGELTSITQSPDTNTANNITTSMAYNYLNVQDIVGNPDKNTVVVTTTVNNVANITDDNGNVDPNASISTTKVYDLFGNVVKSTDGKGNETRYQYDSLNRLKQQTNPDLTHKDVEYDNSLNEIVATDEKGNKQKYAFDSLGRYKNAYALNPDANTWVLAEETNYDGASRVRTKTINIKDDGSQKAVVVNDYYPNGRLSKETVRDGSENGSILSQKEYTYTEFVSDPNGACSKVKVALHRDDANTTNVYQYLDNWGRVVKEQAEVKDPNGILKTLTHTYTYDYAGNMLTSKDFRANDEAWSEAFTSKMEYDYAGRVLKAYNVNNKYVETVYDRLGRKTTDYDYLRNTTTYKYNALNQLTEAVSPFEGTTTRKSQQYYDKNGNLTIQLQQSNKAGETEKYNKVENRYNSMNRLIAVINYNADENNKTYITQYAYDAVGNTTKMFTGLNSLINTDTESGADNDFAVTRYSYNFLNQRTSLTDPLQKTVTYKYDMVGNIREMVDKLKVTTTYDYNPFGMLTNATVNKNGSITYVGYNYDYLGNRIGMTDGSGLTQYKYDDLNRLLEEVKLSDGVKKAYTYDADNNRKSFKLTVNGTEQMSITYTYNKLNQLQNVVYGGNTTSYAYDDNGNRKTLTSGSLTTSYSYNKANLLTNLTNKQGTTVQSQFDYTYFLNGNRATETKLNSPVKNYVYDGLGRLKSESQNNETITYSFDEYHNRYQMAVTGGTSPFTTSYAYDKNNRLLTENKVANGVNSSTSYDYDDNGNQIKKNSGEETTYQYDGFNRLTNVKTAKDTIGYGYNGEGLRTSKDINGSISSQIWDGQDIVMEISGAGFVAGASKPDRFDSEETIGMYVSQQMQIKKYIRGIGLIATEGSAGASSRQYYLFNGHGDVTSLTDASGNVIKNYDYDAFGVEKNPDVNDNNPFRYCGEYFDKETDTIYLRARYYSPSIGRFTTEDTVRSQQIELPNGQIVDDPLCLNLYLYGKNNPIMFTDPSGHVNHPDVFTYIQNNGKSLYSYFINKADSYNFIADTLGSWFDFLTSDGVNTYVDGLEGFANSHMDSFPGMSDAMSLKASDLRSFVTSGGLGDNAYIILDDNERANVISELKVRINNNRAIIETNDRLVAGYQSDIAKYKEKLKIYYASNDKKNIQKMNDVINFLNGEINKLNEESAYADDLVSDCQDIIDINDAYSNAK